MSLSSIVVVALAFITLLRNSSALIAISTGSDGLAPVYSAGGVPQGLAPPYTVLRSIQAGRVMQESTFTSEDQALLVTLDTWSPYTGELQMNALHNAIYQTLHGKEAQVQALTTGFTCTYCLFDTNDQLEDTSTNMRILHGVERYNLRMEAI